MIIEQQSSINPPEPLEGTRITVVIHDHGYRPLDEPGPRVARGGEPVVRSGGSPRRHSGGRHRAPRRSAWDVADRVLGSWPVTLRLVLLLLVLAQLRGEVAAV